MITFRHVIFAEVDVELDRQVELAHGGDTKAFDEANGINDWVAYICAYAGRASAKVSRNQREDSSLNDGERFRANMVKVAALAVAAIESYDNSLRSA